MSCSETGPPTVDRGLQPERTALAWRRTALAFAAVGLLLGRVVAEAAGALALLPVTFGIVAALAILLAERRRYRTQRRLMDAERRGARLAAGAPPLLLAAATGVLGLTALAVALALALTSAFGSH